MTPEEIESVAHNMVAQIRRDQAGGTETDQMQASH
jgi:hypothetical protein